MPASPQASARSPLRSVCGQSPHAIHLVRALAPGPDTPPSKGAYRTTFGLRSCLRLQTSSPARDLHKAQALALLPTAPESPLPPLPFTCSQEGLHLRAEASPWAQAEGAGEPRSQGSYRDSNRLSRALAVGEIISETKALLGELLPFPLSPTSLKHSHAESSAL